MKTAIRKIGNSHGIIIPKIYLEQCGFENDADVSIEDNAIVLRPTFKSPRAGWAEAFNQAEPELEQETIDFLSLSNEFDKDWEW